jgi:hypothetical protein
MTTCKWWRVSNPPHAVIAETLIRGPRSSTPIYGPKVSNPHYFPPYLCWEIIATWWTQKYSMLLQKLDRWLRYRSFALEVQNLPWCSSVYEACVTWDFCIIIPIFFEPTEMGRISNRSLCSFGRNDDVWSPRHLSPRSALEVEIPYNFTPWLC